MSTTKAATGNQLKRLRWWLAMHRPVTLSLLGTLFIIPAAIIGYTLVHQPMPPLDTTPIPIKPRPVVKYYSPLDGTPIQSQADATLPVTGVMIENSPDARPQSGIKQAQVVYEAIAEGGITRFLCLYQQNQPAMIGPVRSLRMYYLDWAAAYQASIVHVGGSYYSLQEVKNGQYRNIDIENHAGTSWRASDRRAPHNVYTTYQKLSDLNKQLGYAKSEFTSFTREDGKTSTHTDATTIDVVMSGDLYNSHYDYDTGTNTYKRSQNGQPHIDREQGQIAPSVIITLNVTMNTVMQDGWREDIATIGTGDGYVFQNGTVREIKWSKADRFSPLKITDQSGANVALTRGQTWIAAVPASSGSVTWH